MFDLRDPQTTRVIPAKDVGPRADAADLPDASPEHPLDSEGHVSLHGTLIGYYRQELDRQADNRREMALDEDYYDNIQWTEEEAAELRARGQAPIVYNVISVSTNWIIGSEKRSRTDFKVLPRRKDEGKAAERKSDILKYLSDVSRTPFQVSRAFEDTVKVGLGWLEDGVQDADDDEPIYSRYESWRNLLHDSSSTELDMKDGRYIFRVKWVDLDIAETLFPERAAQLQDSVEQGSIYSLYGHDDGDPAMDQLEYELDQSAPLSSDYARKRQRVRLIECWYRTPERVQRLRGGAFGGEIFDPNDPRHVEQLQQNLTSLAERPVMRMRLALLTTKHMIWEGPSPYRHNRFPFTPVWGFRRGRDNLPYGVIRGMRDVQDDVNKKASKAQWILSTNKVIMDEGAVDDIDAFAEENARPDAIIVKKPGKELVLGVDRELAPAHLDLMSRSIQMIQQVGGVTDELLGRTTNATSGVAIQARQEQGSVATNKLFDNLRLARQLQGEVQLSLVEQYMTEPKQFRITNARGLPTFVDVNDGLPENDITRTKADFVIDEAAWQASMRQAQVDQLVQMLSTMPPEVAVAILDLVVDAMDVPNRDEIVKRIRQINGQRDPDATEPTPEDLQQQAAAAEQARKADAMFQAELSEKQGKAMKSRADAIVSLRKAAETAVGTQKTAIETAIALLQVPQAAIAADAILEAGTFDESKEPLPPMGLPPPPPPPDLSGGLAAAQAEQAGAVGGLPGAAPPPGPALPPA